MVYTACGFGLHDLPMSLVTGRLGIATTVAFGVYWAIMVIETGRSDRAPGIRAAANVAKITFGLAFGGLADTFLARVMG